MRLFDGGFAELRRRHLQGRRQQHRFRHSRLLSSYLLVKEGTNQLYAVGETSNTTGCSTPTSTTCPWRKNAIGSSCVIFLQLTVDGINMLGASFGQWAVDGT
jgi:hypothetical protein